MTARPNRTHTDWRLRYMCGSKPCSRSLLSVAENTISTPMLAMATLEKRRARSMCRQAAVAPRRRGKTDEVALAVAMVSSNEEGLVDAAGVTHRMGRLAGERFEDTPGDGGSR